MYKKNCVSGITVAKTTKISDMYKLIVEYVVDSKEIDISDGVKKTEIEIETNDCYIIGKDNAMRQFINECEKNTAYSVALYTLERFEDGMIVADKLVIRNDFTNGFYMNKEIIDF